MGFVNPEKISIQIDGKWINAEEGQKLATALVAAGIWKFGETLARHRQRGPFCGMGACFECEVTVDDEKHIQACLCLVRNGMKVNTR